MTRLLFTYAATILWHDRQRYLSAVLAVAFSAVLINLQWGVLFGIFSATSIPIDHTRADIWVGGPAVPSVDLGRPISETHLSRLASQPEVERPETYVLSYAYWVKPDSSKELCIVIGSRLCDGAVGTVAQLTPELRARLAEPGAVVVDEGDLGRLGIGGVGTIAEIAGHRVRVVGLVQGLKGLVGPYVFCSLDTARRLLSFLPDQTTYLLARCRNPLEAPAVVARLRRYVDLSAFTRDEFSRRTRLHWLTMTNGGIATGFTAVLALLVGVVVTSQTLYAATLASLREYAVLRALGIPRWRIAALVLSQSLGVGVIGVVLALPIVLALGRLATAIGTGMLLPWWLLAAVLSVTLLMALVSGLATLRSLRLMEPMSLLR
jgi:putative ABC transport system permease protein